MKHPLEEVWEAAERRRASVRPVAYWAGAYYGWEPFSEFDPCAYIRNQNGRLVPPNSGFYWVIKLANKQLVIARLKGMTAKKRLPKGLLKARGTSHVG